MHNYLIIHGEIYSINEPLHWTFFPKMSFVVRVKKNAKSPEGTSSELKAGGGNAGDQQKEPSKKEGASVFKKMNEEVEKIEKQLEKIPMLVDLSKTYKHRKCTIAAVFLGAALFAILIVYDIKAAFLVDFLSYFYPAYQSVKSVEKGEKGQYKQWLSYWYEKLI